MARKRRLFSQLGLSDDAAQTILDNPPAQRRHATYGPAQRVFIDWAEQQGIDPHVPDPVVFINYLAHQRRTRDWKPNTVLAKRSAILDLFPDRSVITENALYKDYITALKVTNVKPAEIGSLDISPALTFLQSLPVNDDMPLLQLTRKLCWLLGVCGFLRADDIHCIDVSRTQCSDDHLALFIPLPKEKRKGMRIEKVVHIMANSDPTLCPVTAYRSYLSRVADFPSEVPHPKDDKITISPLVRNTVRRSQPVSSQTISNHMDTISTLIPEVEKASRRVKPRAIGSTIAAESGIPIDDVIAHGNWSSPDTFQNFYRLASKTKFNFTEITLGQNSGATL